MLKIVKKTEIILSKDELQKQIDEAYKRGVKDGLLYAKSKDFGAKHKKSKDGMKTDGGKTLKFG